MVNYIISNKNKDSQINRLQHFFFSFRIYSANQLKLENKQGGFLSKIVLLIGLG